MSILIRTAKKEDAKAISRLSSQLGYQISEEDTIYNIELLNESEHDVVYVAILDNNVIGWIHIFYSLRIESKPFCEIGGLVVDENIRGSGIGRMLIKKAVEWSRMKLCETLRVRTNIVRLETHKFYAKMGFTLTKQQNVFGLSLINDTAE
jgi:N-acetylglutamate synthase-like GNAT family acetyltransferase